MPAHQIARIRERPNLSSKIPARLPESRSVETQSLPRDHPVEIDIDRSTKPLPTRLCLLEAAARIGLQVGDVEQIEDDAFFRKRTSRAAPIATDMFVRKDQRMEPGHSPEAHSAPT